MEGVRPTVETGETWIAEMPEGWALVRCGELFSQRAEKGKNTERMLTCSIQSGVMPQEKYEVLTGRKLSKPVNNKENYNKTYKGDLVYNKMRMWQGAVGLSDYDGVVSPAYVVLVCSGKQNSRYSYWQFVSDCFIEQSNSNSKGICDDQNSLSFNRFAQMTMLLPPLFEQQTIASYLDHHTSLIDRERDLIAKKIELLKEKRKALIFEVVTGKRTIVEAESLAGDGGERMEDVVFAGKWAAVPTPKADDPFVKSGRLVDSEVGWIGDVPEGWEIVRIGDVSTLSTGIPAPEDAQAAEDLKSGIPFIRVSDLSSWASRMTGETRDSIPKSYIANKKQKGTIIFPKSGESIRGGVRKFLSEDAVVVSHLACAKARNEISTDEYFYWTLEAVEFEDETNQTSLPSLNLSAIASKPIPLAPISEQQAIASHLDHATNLVDQEITFLKRKYELLSDKRKALIFEAVTGKIDLRDTITT